MANKVLEYTPDGIYTEHGKKRQMEERKFIPDGMPEKKGRPSK